MRSIHPLPLAKMGDEQLLARVEALRPFIETCANDIERDRRLPVALLDRLHEARLFRMLLPRSVDGLEVDPITFMQVIETIARADGSTAWCLSQGGGCATAAAYLDLPVAREVFGDARALLAWGPGPQAKAVAVEGGYRITGSWAFASGGRHATWIGAHGPIFHPDGTPVLNADGKPLERTLLVPAREVQWTDIWDTVGLRGTASDMFKLTDHFVRKEFSITRDHDERECRERGPVYRISPLIHWAIGFASVGLGLARASLDIFLNLAGEKIQRGLKAPLRDNAAVQTQFAYTEAALRAARAGLWQAVNETWQHVQTPDGRLTLAQRAAIRIASTYAIHQAREAVDFAYNTIGTSAVFANHPLERRFRDMHTVTQHLQARSGHFETVGAWMLGADADFTFV